MEKTIQASSSFKFGAAAISDPAIRFDVVKQRRMRLSKLSSAGNLHDIKSDLAIKNVQAWTLREPVSKRRYSVIKIQTNSGITGYGECEPLSITEFAEAKKVIIGIPVTSFEAIAPLLDMFPTARAALNIAMLDVSGKVTKAPIFRFLGGPTRYKVRVLTELKGNSDSELINSMKQAQNAGFKAFLVPIPAVVNRNQGQAFVLATTKRLKSLRAAADSDIDFALDGASLLTPGDAQMISAAIEDFHVLWFNEPCPPINIAALKKISKENVTPIGIGSQTVTGSEIQNFLRENCADIIRPSIGLNGISQIRRMAAIAEPYYVAVGPSHNGGPIGTAASFHLAASIPNFFIQQVPYPEAEADRRMRSELTLSPIEIIKDGFAELPIGNGLGISVNEASLQKYKEESL